MSNDFFNPSGSPSSGASGSSSTMRSEFTSIGAAFDKLPALSGNGSKIVRVNSGATALEAVDAGEILSSSVGFTGDITPTQISANQDDYNPTGLSTAAVLRLSTDASRNITGIQGGADGRLLLLHNVGSFNIVLKNETTSTAANRFSLVADRTMLPKEAVLIQYDLTSLRWRMAGPQFSDFIQTILDDADGAAVMTTIGALPKAGGTMTGDITMSGASIVEAEGAAVTAASSTNIWATDGNTVHVTGNTGIADFATAPQAGAWMKVIFDGTPVLTQSANLNLNAGGANVTIAAGDMAFVYADTTTQMDVFVIRKSGDAVAPAVTSVNGNTGAVRTISLGTATNTTGGTSIDFTSVIPSGAREISIGWTGLSSTGTDPFLIQLMVAGSPVTSGYVSAAEDNSGSATSTAGFIMGAVVAAGNNQGSLTLMLLNASTNTWAVKSGGNYNTSGSTKHVAGSKALAGAVDGIRFTTTGGTNTVDALDTMNISWV